MTETPIAAVVRPVNKVDPAKRWPMGSFTYVDIGAIDQSKKVVTGASKIPSDEAPSRARQLVEAGDVLVSTVRPNLNAVAQVSDDLDGAIASTGFAVLRPDTKFLSSRYLLHWVRGERFISELTRLATGASYPAVTDQIVKRSTIPLPPIEEQRRIAAILDHADGLRIKRHQSLALLNDLVESVFLEVFGDPVSNPKAWISRPLGELLTSQQYGHRFYNEAYSAEGTRIVRITDLNDAGEIDFSEMPRMAVTEQELQKYALRAGDLIFARSGATVGKTGLIREGDPVCIAGAYFITMRFDDVLEPEYAKAVFSSPSVRALIAKRSRQAAQQNFSGPALRRLTVPVPPLELQHQYAGIVKTVRNKKALYCSSSEQLDELFASLRQRAFSGSL